MDTPHHRWRAPTGPLVPRPDQARSERCLAGAAFLATAASVLVVHRWNAGGLLSARGWLDSALFAAVLLAILGAHELGHHLVARRHGMKVSLPLFLPAPFFVGTLGAILRVHDRPRTRTALLEMGAAGPLAGFAVLVVALSIRLGLGAPVQTGEALGRPLLWWLIAGPGAGPVPLLTTADPVCYAAWVGCLVTAMNLLPFGQLDGGHVLVAIAPRLARRIGWGVSAALLALGWLWAGWWAWLLAIHLVASHEAMGAPGSEQPPSLRARLAAAAVVAVLVLCFTPDPW